MESVRRLGRCNASLSGEKLYVFARQENQEVSPLPRPATERAMAREIRGANGPRSRFRHAGPRSPGCSFREVVSWAFPAFFRALMRLGKAAVREG